MNSQCHRRSSKHGYSLVEISLAMLVIGVGLLAALALFPEGLGSATRAVEDVTMSVFAENVFSSIAMETAWWSTNLTWEMDFGAGLVLMISQSLELTGQPLVRALPNYVAVTNFFWVPNFYADPTVDMPQHRTATFTYSLFIGAVPGGGVSRFARLEVWPGEYPAGTRPTSRGRVFYREFMPPK